MRRLFLVAFATTGCTAGEGLEDAGLMGLAAAACRHASGCGCVEPMRLGTEPEPSCENELLRRWPDRRAASVSLPDDPGPVFDNQCLDTLIELIERADCDTDFARFWLDVPCALYHGTRNVGDECDNVVPPVVSACLPGLNCVAGRCEAGHVVVPVEVLPGPGEPCDGIRCDDTAWCDTSSADGPVCRRLGRVGEGCRGHQECETLYCPAAFCDERPGPGEPCGAQELCAEGLVCVDERCESGAAECVPPSVF